MHAQVCGGMRCHQPGEAGDPPRCIVRRHHHRLKRWALAGVAGGASICSQLVAHVWQAGSRLLQLAIKQACRLKQQHTVWCHQHIAGWRRPSSKQASKHASKQQQHITDDCAAVCAVGEASGASICLHHRHWHRHSTGATTTQPISGAATQPSNGTTTTTCS